MPRATGSLTFLWPVVRATTAPNMAVQSARLDIGARLRRMWH